MGTAHYYYRNGHGRIRKETLSSLGAALALARFDIESDMVSLRRPKPTKEPLRIEANGTTYSYEDILSLTDIDAYGGILVRLPLERL